MNEQQNSETCDDDKGELAGPNGKGKGKGKPRSIEIRRIVENGKRRWEMQDEANSPGTKLNFDKDKDEIYKSDWHALTFWISDPKDDLRFHCRPTTALWVARGTKDVEPECPKKPSLDPDDEFIVGSVKKDGKELVVYNSNMVECQLAFALNFVNKKDVDNPWAKIVDCFDPIITNRNSGISRL